MGDKPGPRAELEPAATRSLEECDAVAPLLRQPAYLSEVLAESLTTGSVLGKRYRIERLVGKGGMGAVYLAIDDVLGKDVALKVVNARAAGDLGRLRDEVLLAQEVTHRNVCRTYDLEEVEGHWLVKMEYIDGETLADYVTVAGRLSVTEARAIGREIAHGLAAAHERGVVHRDLKPQNILVEKDSHRVVLMDFGLARLSELAGQAAEGVAGTPEYMAPEQARGREVDGRADLYALGCVLYFMLTGQVVFPAEAAMAAALRHVEDPPPDLRAIRPDVPSWLAQLILRLLEKDPARRPADAAQVAGALAGPPARWRLVGIVCVVAAALASVTWLAWRVTRPGPEWRPSVHELGPVYDEMSMDPTFSPDGKFIVYRSNRTGLDRIYVDRLADGTSRALGSPALSFFSSPRWTRDGRAILCEFSSSQCTASYRIPIDGGDPELLAKDLCKPEDCGGRQVFLSAESPGCPGCPRLVVRESDGREREVVRLRANERMGPAHCDAAGRRVAYSVMESAWGWSRGDIWIAPLDGGSPRQMTFDGLADWFAPSFHPDGKSILISSARSGKVNLWELPLEGEPASQITFGEGPDLQPDVSPDGRSVIFITETVPSSTLFAYSLPDGARRKLSSRVGSLSVLSVTPNGEQIVGKIQRETESYIVAVSTGDGEDRTLASGDTPAVSSDGAEVIYSVPGSPTGVFAVPTKGGEPRRVTEIAGRVRSLAAGPDGTLHLTLVGETSLEAWRAPLAGGVAERETQAPWFRIVPAPAGGWRAAFRTEGSRIEVHILSPAMALDDPAARVLRGVHDLAWDHDGASVVYYEGRNIRRLQVATGQDVVLFEVVEAVLRSQVVGLPPAVSPDGQTIYYVIDDGLRTRRNLISNFGDRPRPR